ncbi:MAG: dihydrofolate reductase family protein [Acidobacteriota bacterium]
MRRIILHIAASLDGFIAGPDGEIDWLFHDADYGMTEFFRSVDTAVMGRKTWDAAVAMGSPRFAGMQHYIVTRTPRPSDDPDVEFVGADVVALVSGLRATAGKDIWLVGGGEIVRMFLDANLIDEVVLSVHPIILGEGIPLFPTGGRVPLKFEKAISFDSGLVQLSYSMQIDLELEQPPS